jgi:hypothetical protein
VTEKLLDELATRLAALGIRGSAADRVLAEARDHLETGGDDADAVRRFGDVDEIARLVAAELATTRTRSSTFVAFSVLAAAGLVSFALLALVPAAGGWPDLFAGHVDALGPFAGIALALLPQISLVSGVLALLAALRLRHADVANAAQLRLLRRRSAVALATGAGTMAMLATFALNLEGELAAWWTSTTIALSALLIVALAGASVRVARSAAPVASPGGDAGDVFDDFDPVLRWAPVRRLQLPEHPWRFAGLCAAAVGIVGLVAGWYAEGDPGSGLVRGIFEAVALLVCFAALGRFLGLRRSKS